MILPTKYDGGSEGVGGVIYSIGSDDINDACLCALNRLRGIEADAIV